MPPSVPVSVDKDSAVVASSEAAIDSPIKYDYNKRVTFESSADNHVGRRNINQTSTAEDKGRTEKVAANNLGTPMERDNNLNTTTNPYYSPSMANSVNPVMDTSLMNTTASFGGSMIGGGGGYGMYSPYGGGYGMSGGGYGMMGGMTPGLGHPGITSLLFNFQSIVFSLGQTMQIVSMNSHALQQIFHSAKQMAEQAAHGLVDVKKYIESSILQLALVESSTTSEEETEDERKRRRRLKAVRWTIALAITCIGYKLVQYVIKARRRRWQDHQQGLLLLGGNTSGYTNDMIARGGVPIYSSDYSNMPPYNTNNGLDTGSSRYGGMGYNNHYRNTGYHTGGMGNSNGYGQHNNMNSGFGSSPHAYGGNSYYDNPGRW